MQDEENTSVAEDVQEKAPEAVVPKPPKKRGRGRPKGTGKRQKRAAADAKREVFLAVDLEKKVVKHQPPQPQPAATTPTPEASWWPDRLKLMLQRCKLMFEDFGLTRSNTHYYAERARTGDAEAIGKLQPLKEAFLELMGRDYENRAVRDADTGDLIRDEDPKNPKRPIQRYERRSRWGLDDGYDMWAERGKRPRPAMWYNSINEHFYSFVTLIEAAKKVAPVKVYGRDRSNLDSFREAHKTAISAETNPVRAEHLEFIQEFIHDGKRHEWRGRR